MTDRDGPPVFLPEPPARPAPEAPPPPSEADRPLPGRGLRLDPTPQDRYRRGLPGWVLWLGLVGMLALSISEGSPLPILFGAAAFYLLRRRKKP